MGVMLDPMTNGWRTPSLVEAIGVVLVGAALWEWLAGDGTFRMQDVGANAVALTAFVASLWLIGRTNILWRQSVLLGFCMVLLGAWSDFTRGDGFDWVYALFAFTGATAACFVLFSLSDRVERRIKNRRRHEAS